MTHFLEFTHEIPERCQIEAAIMVHTYPVINSFNIRTSFENFAKTLKVSKVQEATLLSISILQALIVSAQAIIS